MKTSFAGSEEVSETDLLKSSEASETAQLKSEKLNASELNPTVNVKPESKCETKPESKCETKPVQASPAEAKPSDNLAKQPTPKVLVEKLAVIGSGLSAYSSLIAACSLQTTPLMITGPTLGGTLASPEPLKYWPGAAPNAKFSDLAAALHVQSANLGAKFMFESVKSINTNVQPYVITTNLDKQITASAIIIATGLTPKTLNLKDEVSLLGRSVFTSAATINGPHKDAAIVGNDSLAINEALALSKMVSQVTLICTTSQLSCPPDLALKLSQTTNIHVERDVTIDAYVTDKSTGGPFLYGLSFKRSNKVFTINVTVIVLALGSEPKVDLLPPEAKTPEGFVKTSFTNPNLKGIFAAGSILESTPNQLIMLSASGFTAANAAVHYLSAAANPPAAPVKPETKLAEAEAKAPASALTTKAKPDGLAKATEPTSAVSNTTKQVSTPSAPSKAKITSPSSPLQRFSSTDGRPSKQTNKSPSKPKS
ncbi:MAG: NAD(P)/FAD-dependent oxidoreductase [Candidatus Hodgkinia cicadicola]